MKFAVRNSISLLVLAMALVGLVNLVSSADPSTSCSTAQLQKTGAQLCNSKGFFAVPCKLVIDQFVQVFSAACFTTNAIVGSAADIIPGSSTVSDKALSSPTASPPPAAAK